MGKLTSNKANIIYSEILMNNVNHEYLNDGFKLPS